MRGGSPEGPLHLESNQAIELKGVFHRQLLGEDFKEALHDQIRCLVLRHPAAHQIEDLIIRDATHGGLVAHRGVVLLNIDVRICFGAAPLIEDQRIAAHVAGLVSDGAVVQIGMGSLPEGVLARLGHLRHLGLHTGIFTDGMQALMESGVVDNSTKRFKPGVSMSTMAGGSADLYRYMHRNPAVEMHPCDVTHGPQVLAQMDGFCAINSALQVDLAGCVNAEWVGSRRISLPGGLPNFAQGAMQAKKGLAIIVMMYRNIHSVDIQFLNRLKH